MTLAAAGQPPHSEEVAMLKWASPRQVDVRRQHASAAARDNVSRAFESMQAVQLGAFTDRVAGVMLEATEVAYSIVPDCHLVELDPAALGRTRTATATDTGTFVVTNRRCVFVGAQHSREWLYTKMRTVGHNGDETAIYMSDEHLAASVRCAVGAHVISARILAAMARYRDSDLHASLVEQVNTDYRDAWSEWQALEAECA
jgi:hypothetical protein